MVIRYITLDTVKEQVLEVNILCPRVLVMALVGQTHLDAREVTLRPA